MWAWLLLLGGVLLEASPRTSITQLIRDVSTEPFLENNDQKIARKLSHARLSERLDTAVIDVLKMYGAGPETVKALLRLQKQTAFLPAPANPPVNLSDRPAPDLQSDILRRAFSYVENYIHALPDFLCDQTSRRYVNYIRKPSPVYARYLDDWRPDDKRVEIVRFVNGTESYQRVAGDRRKGWRMKDSTDHEEHTGEFGSDMRLVVAPGLGAYRWHHWETSAGHRLAVFSYIINAAKTQYTVGYCCISDPVRGPLQQVCRSPIRGYVYLEPETGAIKRLTIATYGIPSTFPINEDHVVIDYRSVAIAGHAFLCPTAAFHYMRSGQQRNRTDVEFRNYRRFEVESTLKTDGQ